MKNRWVKALVLVGIFAGFYLGAHFWLRWKNSVTDDVTKSRKMVDCDPNDVRGIEVVSNGPNGPETRRFERIDKMPKGTPAAAQLSQSEWKYLAPFEGEADSSLMNRFVVVFCDSFDPVPLRDSDFSPGTGPAQRITFEVKGDKAAGKHVLEIGNLTPERMLVVKYSSPNGDSRVLKLPPVLAQQASLEAIAYLNTRVTRMTSDNINVASVYSGKNEVFTLERDGEDWRVLKAGKPVGKGKASPEANKYVNRLTTLRALKADREGLSPAACDEKTSRMHVQLNGVGDKKETLFFQYGKSGPLTVCNTAREALFTVHRDFLPYLAAEPKKLALF